MSRDPPFTLLLIEDNPGDARYIREALREATGLSGRALGRGRGAFPEHVTGSDPELIHEDRLAAGLERLDERPDVVLLDLNLPDSAGIDTLTTVLRRTETVPIVVLTGVSDRDTGIEALRRGADEYLVKDEITADLLIRSVYHAIERKAHERELKRYETLIQESTDVNAILDPDGTIRYLTPSVTHVLGYDPDKLTGENSLDFVHPDDRSEVKAEYAAMVEDPDYRLTVEFRVRDADGSWVDLQARGRNLLDEPLIEGLVVYTHDITGRKERERALEHQREQLKALNDLNAVVRDITGAALQQSTQEEIEALVCERLAETDSYLFSWIGNVDQSRHVVTLRTEAGVEDYLDGVEITYDDSTTGSGPTGQAIRTREMQVCRDVLEDTDYREFRQRAREYGFRSSAAIPIVHEGTLYGVLNVYSSRRDAFSGQEGSVIGQLGEVIGHAIAAIERKEALMSDDVVEIAFEIQNAFEEVGVPNARSGTVTIDRTVPAGNGRHLLYGTADDDGLATLRAIAEAASHWESVDVLTEPGEEVQFEVCLTEPPVFTLIASQSGRVREAKIEEGDYHLTVHLPHGSDVRRLVDGVQEAYPDAEVIAQRQTTREVGSTAGVSTAVLDGLTERQRAALESAYYAGFFEWPRDSTGEDVAASLDIAPATFHQHIRAGERKIFSSLFTGR